MKSIKYFKYIMLSAAVVLAASCQKDDTKNVDMTTRVGLSPEQENFAANGSTESGEDSFVGIVTVAHGNKVNTLSWDAEIAEGIAWASVEKTVVTTNFKETFNDNVHTVQETGIEVKVEPNTEYKRSFTVEIRVADGTVVPFEFTQMGEKADAAVSTTVKDVEFFAKGGSEIITYTTNMGNEYDFAVKYGENSSDWLTWAADEAGKVTLTATEWTDKTNTRTATFTIIVGNDATSKASIDIPVVQLAADEYYYMYGASCNGITIDKAIQLEKKNSGIYAGATYFMATADGKNPILLNRDSRVLAYPCFALAADGKVVEIASADAALPAGPAIDIDGLRTVSVNMADRTWSWERITTQNCMPDSEVAGYKTKAFIARDGSMKTWMIEFLRWDGGNTTPKLGSPMVESATGIGSTGDGGYAAKDFPSSWDDFSSLNMAWETTEIGGQLVGSNAHGRLYSLSEMLTGNPMAGIGIARYELIPEEWRAGNVITDAIGNEVTLEYLDCTVADTFSTDSKADEASYPTLTMQVQGICPYGWHIANAADWLDIAYAVSQASEGHSYPVSESDLNYKNFTTAKVGIDNLATWLRNEKYWKGGDISDGSDEFGFEYYPLGWRYMTQGFQYYGSRAQCWVPLFRLDAKNGPCKGYRINVILGNNVKYAELTQIDNGQAIMPFRCVKNYKK